MAFTPWGDKCEPSRHYHNKEPGFGHLPLKSCSLALVCPKVFAWPYPLLFRLSVPSLTSVLSLPSQK